MFVLFQQLLAGTDKLDQVQSLELRVDTSETTLNNFGTLLPNLTVLKLSGSLIPCIRYRASCHLLLFLSGFNQHVIHFISYVRIWHCPHCFLFLALAYYNYFQKEWFISETSFTHLVHSKFFWGLCRRFFPSCLIPVDFLACSFVIVILVTLVCTETLALHCISWKYSGCLGAVWKNWMAYQPCCNYGKFT